MLKTLVLRRMIDTHLAEEAALLSRALWLPLGPKAEMALQLHYALGHDRQTCSHSLRKTGELHLQAPPLEAPGLTTVAAIGRPLEATMCNDTEI